MKEAFYGFDVNKCANISDKKIEKLLNSPQGYFIRSKGKINAIKTNARLILEIEKKHPFWKWLWQFAPQNDIERLKTKRCITGTHMRSPSISEKT